VEGKSEVRIHGRMIRVQARIAQIHGFSGHADRRGLLKWLGHLREPPRRVFLTHGDEDVSLGFAEHIHNSMGWPVHVPEYGESVVLD
jgi:metallo-beta-lactamase family protein